MNSFDVVVVDVVFFFGFERKRRFRFVSVGLFYYVGACV